MRDSASFRRIALVLDDEAQRKRFAAHLPARTVIHEAPGGTELRRLAAAHAIDLMVGGVLNRNDQFLAVTLRELSRTSPEIAMIGVFEPSRPSLDEAADLARELPGMGFVYRPDNRFEYLIRLRDPGRPPVFTSALIDCLSHLPLHGAARDFARLQALHPSLSLSIPEQAKLLGVSRRNLERWFQGPDICSAGCFQSVCAAAEAAYLRLTGGLAEQEIASIIGVLTRDGIVNPMAVPRSIRSALGVGLEELRSGGIPLLMEAVETALRTSRDPTRSPAQWGDESRYAPEPGVLAVSVEHRLVLMDPTRRLELPLDAFGSDAWHLLTQSASFARMTAELALLRREPPHSVRSRLIALLGELLVKRLIRREPGGREAGEA